MTQGEFEGPPWQLDWTKQDREYRDSLPDDARELLMDAAFELITAADPYRVEGVEPVRSTQPRGRHVIYAGGGRGWLEFSFVRRVAEPQIQVTGIFWQ